MSKSLFKSKTFWLQALGIAQLATGVLPIDPQTTGYVLAGLTVATRLVTKGAVHVLGNAARE